MSKNTNTLPATTAGQNGTNNTPATTEPFNLKKKVYEDVKQAASNFEEKHPGVTRKLACATAIGIAGTAIVDTVIVLTA